MTFDAQRPAPYPAYPVRRRPHPALLAAGIVQLVLTPIAGLFLTVVGIGLGACAGGASTGGCGRLSTDYTLATVALGLDAAVGLVTVLIVQQPRGRRLRRTLAGAVVVTLGLSFCCCTRLALA